MLHGTSLFSMILHITWLYVKQHQSLIRRIDCYTNSVILLQTYEIPTSLVTYACYHTEFIKLNMTIEFMLKSITMCTLV